ncbi:MULTISPECIES: transposase [unclassified Burkholderia]|uniref:transposase n=1 Tax=unclassified Burkholderia TaxID=2613784 RepID=UPI001623535B|nr:MULTISPECIES: transposase [unclassified Burkholderia]
MNVLSIESLLARHANVRLDSEQVPRLDATGVRALHVPRALDASLAVIATLSHEIQAIELILHREVRLRPEFEVLKSAPSIGDILAATIMLETGTVARFPSLGQFSSYCRCVESKRVSNGRMRLTRFDGHLRNRGGGGWRAPVPDDVERPTAH